eukprot:scaffold37202_cov150-Skeletonema_dohrnii-CCMP3373.AAC.2
MARQDVQSASRCSLEPNNSKMMPSPGIPMTFPERSVSCLLKEDNDDDDLDALATINQALRSADVSERKTRLSWELHLKRIATWLNNEMSTTATA